LNSVSKHNYLEQIIGSTDSPVEIVFV